MTIEKAGMLGVDTLLMKPLVLHDLRLAIQRVLASCRSVLRERVRHADRGQHTRHVLAFQHAYKPAPADTLGLPHAKDERWPVRLDILQGVAAYVQQTLATLEGRNEHD